VDENTRWPSVFFSDDDDEDEVPETLSKAMLEAVKASFANIHTRPIILPILQVVLHLLPQQRGYSRVVTSRLAFGSSVNVCK
jgi:hypothetical protein